MNESSWQTRCRGWWLALSKAGFARAWETAIAQNSEEQAFLLSSAKVPAGGVRPTFLAMSMKCSNPGQWAERLLACGANPHAEMPGVVRQSWLCAAAFLGRASVVNALIAHGANPDLKNDFSHSPLEACFSHWPQQEDASAFRLTALLLLEKGATARPETVSAAPLDEPVFRALLAVGAKPSREFVLKACRLLPEPALSTWLATFDRVGWGASSSMWSGKPLAWALLSGDTSAPVADLLSALRKWGYQLQGTNAKGVSLTHAWALSGSKRHMEWGLELLGDASLAENLELKDAKGRTVRGIFETRFETMAGIPGVDASALDVFHQIFPLVDAALSSRRMLATLSTEGVSSPRGRL
jgi:hypothetical protein